MDDDIQEDLDQAAEHQQQLIERERREAELKVLLDRHPQFQAELAVEIAKIKAMNFALDAIFGPRPF